MNSKPILIVAGEPNSIFFEIFFKSLQSKNFNKPIILIGSLKILQLQMKKLNYRKKINLLNTKNLTNKKINNKEINLINVEYNQKKAFEKLSKKSNTYIKTSFDLAVKLIKEGFSDKLINGPISKKNFLKNKYAGMTEYFASKTGNKNKEVMLIYNRNLSVSPITTHLPLKKIFTRITT